MPESNLMAPRGAVTHLAHYGRTDGVWRITWDMGKGKRKDTLQMAAGPTLVYQMWERLDSHLSVIIETTVTNPGEERQVSDAKVAARELAEILAMFMKPHFTSADAIAGEAMRRREARLAGEEVETAGVGSLRFTPPPGTVKYDQPRKAPRPAKKSTPKRTGSIPQDSVDGIRVALQSGKFTVEQLANLYNVPVEEVEKLKG